MSPQRELLKDKGGSQATSEVTLVNSTPCVSAAELTHRSSVRAWLTFPGTRAPAAGGGHWRRGGRPGPAAQHAGSCLSLVPAHKPGCSETCRPLPLHPHPSLDKLFGTVPQNYLTGCLLNYGPHFAPNKTSLTSLTLCTYSVNSMKGRPTVPLPSE